MDRTTHLGLALAAAALLVSGALPTQAEKTPYGAEGHVELDFESEHNFDLDDQSWEDFATLEPEMRLRLWYIPSHYFQLIFQPRPRRKSTLHDEDKTKEREFVLQLEQAYVATETKEGAVYLSVGRNRFRDSREWLYDAELDGLRVVLNAFDTRVELWANRETWGSKDLLRSDKEDPVNNFHVYAERELPSDGFVAAYWLGQDEVDVDNQRRHFLGLRAEVEPVKGLNCQAELAHVRGTDGDTDISGVGADVALYYKLPLPGRPYPILGYAFGSGDDDPSDNTDHAFRQTGFQDNNGRFGGVNRYKFYGEMVEPDLSNIMILTAGAGFRPSRKSSVDLVYHHYRQHHASDELWDTNLDMDPSGERLFLGQALDLVLGYREVKNLKLEFVTSWFTPGSAFPTDASNAVFVGFEARYMFSTEE